MSNTKPIYPPQNNAEAIELNIHNSDQFHQVLNGDINTDIDTYEGNGKIPSVAKAMFTMAAYRTPIDWVEGETETELTQTRLFNGFVYVPTMVPAPMGSAPTDSNWKLYFQSIGDSSTDSGFNYYREEVSTPNKTIFTLPFEYEIKPIGGNLVANIFVTVTAQDANENGLVDIDLVDGVQFPVDTPTTNQLVLTTPLNVGDILQVRMETLATFTIVAGQVEVAEAWASNPEDVPIPNQPTTKYSSLHWAAKSEEAAEAITPPANLPSVQPTYHFDAAVGTLNEVVDRPTQQAAKAANGQLWFAAEDTLPSFWKGEQYGFEVFDQRTNYLKNSEEFSKTGVWGLDDVTIAEDVIGAPTSAIVADKVIENTADSTHGVYQGFIDTAPETEYNVSFFLKAGERSVALIWVWNDNTSPVASAQFNVATGTIEGASGVAENIEIEAYQEAWYRCSFTFKTDTVDSPHHVAVYLVNGSSMYAGDGVSGLYLWGAALTNGYNKCPYIYSGDTWGTLQKTYTITKYFHWLNKVEGTFVVEYEHKDAGYYNGFLFATGAYPAGAIYGLANANQLKFGSTTNSGSSVVDLVVPDGKVRMACSYSDQKMTLSANGSDVERVDNPYFANAPWSSFAIGSNAWNALEQLNGTIYNITYYPKQVTDAELKALSTP